MPVGDYFITEVSKSDVTPQSIFWYLIDFWSLWRTNSIFRFDPAWLWFLPVLYLTTVLSTPLHLYAERREGRYLIGAGLVWVLQALLLRQLSGYGFPGFPLYLLLTPVAAVVLVRLVPLPPRDRPSPETARARFAAIYALSLCSVTSTIGCVEHLRYADMESATLKVLPQLFLYPTFYVHGYFRERWSQAGGDKNDPTLSCSVAFSFMFGCFFGFLALFAGSATDDIETPAWPVVSQSFKNGKTLFPHAYVLGTWVWIGIADALFTAYADDEMVPEVYHHASTSTIIVYILHWVFIKPYVWWILRDWGLRGSNGWGLRYFAVLSTFILAVAGSLAVYALLLRYKTIGRILGL
jgi:hypothetical protein